MEQDIINDYQQRIAAAQEEVSKYEKLTNSYSIQRLVAFGLLIFFVCLSVVAATHYLIRLDEKIVIVGFVIVYGVFDLANLIASYKFACDGDLRKRGSQAP